MKQLLFYLLAALLLAGCGASTTKTEEAEEVARTYTQISQEEAIEMMARDDGHVVVDVRRVDEYAAGHIPGAILIPNEDIDATPPAALPDLDQIILIYCRSGNRSKQASQKLADMGYTHVYEFGGIITWPGEVVTEEAPYAAPSAAGEPAALGFDSFEGGGPEYSVEVADPALVSVASARSYASAGHDEEDGAGFTVTITFTGVKPGQTTATVQARSPIAENFDALYAVTVDENLNVTLVQTEYKELE